MHTITVTRDPAGESGLWPLAVDIINYMESESEKKRIIVHTPSEVFYTMGTLVYWMTALNNSGYKFEKVDRNFMVNINNITLLNRSTQSAYFESEIRKNSQKIGISYHRYKEYEALIKLFNPRVIII